MSKEVLMTIGLPGIGKSTYVNQLLAGRPHTWLNADSIRKELTGDEGNISRDHQVWPIFHDRFEKALASPAPESQVIVLDNTNLKQSARQPCLNAIRAAMQQGQQVLLKVVEFPMDVNLALARQKQRARQVPPEVIRRMAATFEPLSAAETQGITAQHVQVKDNGSGSWVA